jgi:hypothetical protein
VTATAAALPGGHLGNHQQPQPQQQQQLQFWPLLQSLSLCFGSGSQLQPKLQMSGLTCFINLHIVSCIVVAPGSNVPQQLRKLILDLVNLEMGWFT